MVGRIVVAELEDAVRPEQTDRGRVGIAAVAGWDNTRDLDRGTA